MASLLVSLIPVSGFLYFIIFITSASVNKPFGIFLAIILMWWINEFIKELKK